MQIIVFLLRYICVLSVYIEYLILGRLSIFAAAVSAGGPFPPCALSGFLHGPEEAGSCVNYRKLLTLGMADKIREYLAEIGRRGGQKSRRTLDAETARSMVRVREARRAYRRFRTSCFWSYRPDLHIGLDDVNWVAETLMKNGNREAWRVGRSLCL